MGLVLNGWTGCLFVEGHTTEDWQLNGKISGPDVQKMLAEMNPAERGRIQRVHLEGRWGIRALNLIDLPNQVREIYLDRCIFLRELKNLPKGLKILSLESCSLLQPTPELIGELSALEETGCTLKLPNRFGSLRAGFSAESVKYQLEQLCLGSTPIAWPAVDSHVAIWSATKVIQAFESNPLATRAMVNNVLCSMTHASTTTIWQGFVKGLTARKLGQRSLPDCEGKRIREEEANAQVAENVPPPVQNADRRPALGAFAR